MVRHRVVTAIQCQFPSLYIELCHWYAECIIFLNEFFSVIDLASDEEYCVPYILALTNGVQCLAQVVVKLRKNNNSMTLAHAIDKNSADQHKHNES